VLLGVGIFIAGQIALRWPPESRARAGVVVLISLLAWRLAQWVRELGGSMSWVNASMVGALGVAAGVWLAWPRHVRRMPLFFSIAAAGVAGGLLFTAAYRLRLDPTGRSLWPLLLICIWQGALVTTAALALRFTDDEPSP
jgi:hypothetical protein